MSPAKICDTLNRLLAIHGSSLPMYLASAAPWISRTDEDARATLSSIVSDQRSTIDRLGELVTENGGRADAAAFPMEFTSYHDLSLDFLLHKMIEKQRQAIDGIRQIIDELSDEAAIRPVVEESLGAAKGHLDSLQELLTDSPKV